MRNCGYHRADLVLRAKQARHIVAAIYGRSAPYVFPVSTVLQTTSVYFCVAAAADCFIAIVLPSRFKDSCCTPRYDVSRL
uniref:Uncharacterized protein n=1 Tax=Parascaris equorum TaxID=6256 RepID=A0A914SDZ7_PAREQ